MSAGANEYAMGLLEYSGEPVLSRSGFETLPDKKYYNTYLSANKDRADFPSVQADKACNGNVCYGHALSETYGATSDYYGWYGNSVTFPYYNYPWFLYGGYSSLSTSGIFCVGPYNGLPYVGYSTRLILTP